MEIYLGTPGTSKTLRVLRRIGKSAEILSSRQHRIITIFTEYVQITAAQPAYPSVVSLDNPRSLLVVWSGASQTGPRDVAHLARLDCVAETPPAPGP